MLQHNERFQNDLQRYTIAIDNLQDIQLKSQATRLLNDLIQAVKELDNRYVDMVYAKQLPSMGNEMRDKITQIRRQLDQLVKKS